MTKPGDIREHLVRAPIADLVGPFDLDNPAAAERLKLPPSRWNLTGFLAPQACAARFAARSIRTGICPTSRNPCLTG